MDNIKETFKRNVNPEKFAKLTKTKLLESFVKGSDYQEDFDCLKKDFPEFLDSFNVSDCWVDKNGFQREVRGNHFLICEKKNDSYFIIGEVCFDEKTNKPRWGRFAETGMFSRMDNLIVCGKDVLKGMVPDSENLYPPANSSEMSFKMLDYFKSNESKLSLEYQKYSKRLNLEFMDFKGYRLKAYFFYDKTPFNVNYILDEYELVTKANEFPEQKSKKILEGGDLNCKCPFEKELIEIRDFFYELINNDFKKNELDTYTNTYKLCEKIISKYKTK